MVIIVIIILIFIIIIFRDQSQISQVFCEETKDRCLFDQARKQTTNQAGLMICCSGTIISEYPKLRNFLHYKIFTKQIVGIRDS